MRGVARLARRAGLGLLVGAVLHGTADAQVPDTVRVRRDTAVVEAPVAPLDSAVLAAEPPPDTTARVDTVKAPLPYAPAPPTLGIGASYRWDRAELFASGALTLLDLLERIPGVSGFRTGYLAAPQVAAWAGDPRRVRIFFDGLELTAMDPNVGEVPDLSEFALWSLEELVVERGATELRVYMRTWRVNLTTPYSRTDVATGDENTNIFRGWFGRRFARGEALQVAGEQYGTTSPRFGGGGDRLLLLARVGWAAGPWGADAFMMRGTRARTLLRGQGGLTIPATETRSTTAYVRTGYGAPERGAWLNLLAAHMRFDDETPPATGATDTVEIVRTRAEYVASAGLTRGAAALQVDHRTRTFLGGAAHGQSARLSFTSGGIGAVLYGEHGHDTVTRYEASVQATPFGFLSVLASAGHVHDRRSWVTESRTNHARAEAGVRVGDLWLSGGALYRDAVLLAAPVVFDPLFESRVEDEALGGFAQLRGRIWRDVRLDVSATFWENAGFHRPQFLSRSQLYVDTRWLSRFPRGNFGALISVRHDYRTFTPFPRAGATVTAPESWNISTQLEIRIQNAVVFWQLRDVIPRLDQTVPGFELPPGPINLYGIRWEFWN